MTSTATTPTVHSQDTAPIDTEVDTSIVPETPNIDRHPRAYPRKIDMFNCDWCHLPLTEGPGAATIRKQCFICGTSCCHECADLGKGKNLTYIGRRYICDECTRDLVTHVETFTENHLVKRLKRQKRNVRHLSSRGELFFTRRNNKYE